MMTYFFDPPAPLTKVTLRGQEHDTILPDVSMLLDSGADVTLIPQDAVHVLGVSVSPNESYEYGRLNPLFKKPDVGFGSFTIRVLLPRHQPA
jgi:hypothetical protein